MHFTLCLQTVQITTGGTVYRLEKPRYLKALAATSEPSDDWGPKKKVNQTGIYAHLRSAAEMKKGLSTPSRLNMRSGATSPISEKGFQNPVYYPDLSEKTN